MATFLMFRLYAPLGAFGDVAVGERRGGFDRPGRSAVFGLVAAALGIDRRDNEAHAALDESYALVLRIEASGKLVEDYHTVQAPPARTGKARGTSWPTRRAALSRKNELETLLSSRDYRADPISTIVLVARRDAPNAFPPERIAEALRSPVYTLYLGRKACPIGLPLRAAVIVADRLADALDIYDAGATVPEKGLLEALRVLPAGDRFYADADLADPDCNILFPHFELKRVEHRRDRATSRQHWQFDLRGELVLARAAMPEVKS